MEEDLLFTEMDEFRDSDIVVPTELEKEIEKSLVEDEFPESVDEEKKDVLDGSDPTKDTSSLLFSFASTLVEEGVLPSLELKDNPIETTEDLVQAIRREIKANEFGDLTPLQKEAVEAFRNGIDVEKFVKNKERQTTLDTLTKDDIEDDLELRKQLIKEDFLSKGFSEDKSNKLVQRSIDLGEDLEDALDALEAQKKLSKLTLQKEIEQNRIAKELAEKQYTEELEKLKTTVYNETNEVIPGIKFNKNIADQVYESMTKVVEEVGGQPINKIMKDRMKDPIGFEYKLHYLYTITKGFTDFSKLSTTAKTNAAKSFEEKLKLNSFNPATPNRRSEPSDNDLAALERMFG
jgi:hypothetical protein